MSYWVIANVLDCVSFNFVFAFVMLGTDSRASCIWSVCCTIELYMVCRVCDIPPNHIPNSQIVFQKFLQILNSSTMTI